MSDVFILQNHDSLYLDKHGQWTDGRDANALYRTTHKDEALNQKLELTVKHPELRLTIVNCRLDDKGRPQLTPNANSDEEPLSAEQSSCSHTA